MAIKDFTNISEIAQEQENFQGEGEFTTTVSVCPHCDGYHEEVSFRKLKTPVSDGGREVTHVGICPSTELQLRLSFLPAAVVAAREKASQVTSVGQQLHVDNMSQEDIDRVLKALRDA